jgi:hypothetical protein
MGVRNDKQLSDSQEGFCSTQLLDNHSIKKKSAQDLKL